MNSHRLSALVLLFVGILPLAAQVGERRNDLAIGVNGGVAINKIFFVPKVNQKFHFGPTFGVTMRYTCEKYFGAVCALQVELNYAQLGWKERIHNAQNNPLPDTYQRQQNYIQLPFLARLGWGREYKGLMGYLILGPQIGYCIEEKSKRSKVWTLNGAGVPDRPANRYEQYDMPIERPFDYGITGGLGLELSTKVGHFLLEGRYYYGLSDIFNNSKKDVFARSANGSIIAKVTYLIDVNKKRRNK